MPTCPTCSGTIIEYSASAGNGFCVSCGTVVEENTIVNEITFGESSSGAAIVQGSYVGQGARGARMGGPFGNRGSIESREQTMMNANKKIRQIATVLRLPETHSQKAARYYELAVETKFTKGRKSIYVVASCLYVVAREAKSSVMLIDFSDLLQVNVFVLGSTYLALLTSLSLHASIPPIDPSIYIPRFSSLLEFGPETQQVSLDAIRLCARFNRDWLVIGRRPAGICGAALYIAARMNNFRRSVSEIVQVVKIGDSTLRKRLGEFGKTGSAELSVERFRGVWIEEEGVPPAFEKGREREERERLRIMAVAIQEAGKDTEGEREKKKKGKKGKGKGKKRKREECDQEGAAPPVKEKEQRQPVANETPPLPIDPALLDTGILTGTALTENPVPVAQDPPGASGDTVTAFPTTNSNPPDSASNPPNQPQLPPPQNLDTEALFLASPVASDTEEDPTTAPLPRSQTQVLKSSDLNVALRALPPLSGYEKALDRRLEDEIGGFVGEMEGLSPAPAPAPVPTIDGDEGGAEMDLDLIVDASGDDGTVKTGPSLEPAPPPETQQDKEASVPTAPAPTTTEGESGQSSDQPSTTETTAKPHGGTETEVGEGGEEVDAIGPFSDDVEKELDAFILSSDDVAIKERVWVELNKDYLVHIALKAEKEAREEREGGGCSAKARKKRKSTQKPRDASTPAGATTSESVRSMVKKGNKFSKRINYEAIESLFGPSSNSFGADAKMDQLTDSGKLWTFEDGGRTGSVGIGASMGVDYPYDERHEETDADAEGEMVQIIEEEGGGVGVGAKQRARSRGAVSERTDDIGTEYEGDETMLEDDHDHDQRGEVSFGDYNYDEVYEQEV